MAHKIRREPHAAHTANGAGWDLEWIDAQADTRIEVLGLPRGFTYHSGYRDADGKQHWMYTRKVNLSPGRCDRCPPEPMPAARYDEANPRGCCAEGTTMHLRCNDCDYCHTHAPELARAAHAEA